MFTACTHAFESGATCNSPAVRGTSDKPKNFFLDSDLSHAGLSPQSIAKPETLAQENAHANNEELKSDKAFDPQLNRAGRRI